MSTTSWERRVNNLTGYNSYRSMHWDTSMDAIAAGDRHLAERRRAADRPRRTHRTRVTPRRFV